jgi:putative addiction module component (TIGR02574 family)
MARAHEHLAQLLVLSAEERIEVANALLDSVEGEEEAGWEEAWADELRRRVKGLQDGSRRAIDADTARARVAERLRTLRR